MADSSQAHVTSVERAIAILEALDCSRRGLNISELSRKLRIPKSTTHVLVLTLARLGYATRDVGGRNYSLAPRVYSLGRQMMQSSWLPQVALPYLEQLAERTNLTVHLAILEKDQASYVQKVDGPGLIRFDTFIGKRTNLHCTAVGKVLLAFAPEFVRHKFLSKNSFARHTTKTITSAGVLRKEIEKVRERQYAIDDQEEELDVRCLAVPVFNPSGEFLAALGVTGTTGQLPLEESERLAALGLKMARRIYGGDGPGN